MRTVDPNGSSADTSPWYTIRSKGIISVFGVLASGQMEIDKGRKSEEPRWSTLEHPPDTVHSGASRCGANLNSSYTRER